jgi:hypothetical protein
MDEQTKGGVVLGVIVTICVAIFLCCILTAPDGEITGHSLRSGFEGPDYVVYVDVSVYNRGGPGTVTVYVRFTPILSEYSHLFLQKTQDIHLESEESQNLTIKFECFESEESLPKYMLDVWCN